MPSNSQRNIHDTPSGANNNNKNKYITRIKIPSRELKDYASCSTVNDDQVDHKFRKEHYAVDDFLFKARNNSKQSSQKKISMSIPRCVVVQRPVTCCRNDVLIKKVEKQKSVPGPIKNIDFDLTDEKPTVNPEDVPMDWDNYHRLKVIHTFMEDLEYNFPSLCTTGIIGKSLEGRDLKILKISNSEASNTCVWIDAGIHAREWIAPAVNTYIANHIARNFDGLPESVRSKDWYFLPVINPDGYEYSHTTHRMWRKNKACIKKELFGVDLNRNFSYGWGGKGSSGEPKHAFYRGPRPFSEPESSAMRDIFLNSGVTFKVYITLHSFGQVIIMPFACSETLAPDYITLLQGATVMSKAIYDTNGNTYKVGVSKDLMYMASGTSNDWSHGVVGIPFCYLIELRSKKHKFKLPKEEIAETGAEILNCVIALMEFVDSYNNTKIKKSLKVISDSVYVKENSEEDLKNESYTGSENLELVPSKHSDVKTEVKEVEINSNFEKSIQSDIEIELEKQIELITRLILKQIESQKQETSTKDSADSEVQVDTHNEVGSETEEIPEIPNHVISRVESEQLQISLYSVEETENKEIESNSTAESNYSTYRT